MLQTSISTLSDPSKEGWQKVCVGVCMFVRACMRVLVLVCGMAGISLIMCDGVPLFQAI